MWSIQICFSFSAKLLFISWFSSVMCGWIGFVFPRSFLFWILERIWDGMGLLRLLMLPRGMNSLSACMIVSVMNLVS